MGTTQLKCSEGMRQYCTLQGVQETAIELNHSWKSRDKQQTQFNEINCLFVHQSQGDKQFKMSSNLSHHITYTWKTIKTKPMKLHKNLV